MIKIRAIAVLCLILWESISINCKPLDGRFYTFPVYGASLVQPSTYSFIINNGETYFALCNNWMITLNFRFDSLNIDPVLFAQYSNIKSMNINRDSLPVICSENAISYKKSGKWRTFRSEDGLPTDKLYSMAKTSSGKIIISSKAGMFEFDEGKVLPDTVVFDISKGEFEHFPQNHSSMGVAGDTLFYVSDDNTLYKYINGQIIKIIKYERFFDNCFQYVGGFDNVNDKIYYYIYHKQSRTFKIMCYDGGISEYIDIFKSNFPIKDSLDFGLNGFCVDKKGRAWIAASYAIKGNRTIYVLYVWDGSKWVDTEIRKKFGSYDFSGLKCIEDRVFIMTLTNWGNQMIVYDDDPTSVEYQEIKGGAAVYPNPVQSRATLTLLREKQGRCIIHSVDIFGREKILWQGGLQEGRNDVQIDLSGLSAGCYNLLIEDDNNRQYVRVIKE